MQRQREALKLAYRVFQGCSSVGGPTQLLLPQAGGAQQQALVSLLQQQAKALHSTATPAPLRQLLAASAARSGGRSTAGTQRCLLPQRHAATQLRRPFSADTGGVAKAKVQPRSKSMEGKRSLWSGLLLLAPGVLAGFLGKWQLDRRNWKLDLLRRRELMLTGEPVDLFDVEDCPPEYTRVRVAGEFEYGKTLYVGPRVRSIMARADKGYLAVTPLYSPELHRTVLVNRGWVPAAWRDSEAERAKGEPKGQVVVEGVLRLGEQPGEFVPANVPEKGEWYYLNAMQMAQACGLPADTPFMEVVAGDEPAYREPTAVDLLHGKRPATPRPADEFPLAKSTEEFMQWSVMPRDHMNYALTWFTLSAAVSGLAVKAIRQGVRAAPK